MRHTSALQILRYMRANYGRKLSISAVCRGVELSYQPIYYHIRQLEKLAVLGTFKFGRESLCMFVNSPATALWLGMLCHEQQKQATGLPAELTAGLRPYLSQRWDAFDCIAVLLEENRLIAVLKSLETQAADSIVARCQALSAVLRVELMDSGQFLQHFETASGLIWAQRAVIIAGHQDFWQYALAAGEGLGLVLPAPSD